MIVEAILQEEAQIRQESEARGIDIGKRERDRQHVQRMLAKGYLFTVIADLLGLSEKRCRP
ncbi:MAG: hypothetical protein R3E79_55390 [Caldilineaceae bacterium]